MWFNIYTYIFSQLGSVSNRTIYLVNATRPRHSYNPSGSIWFHKTSNNFFLSSASHQSLRSTDDDALKAVKCDGKPDCAIAEDECDAGCESKLMLENIK